MVANECSGKMNIDFTTAFHAGTRMDAALPAGQKNVGTKSSLVSLVISYTLQVPHFTRLNSCRMPATWVNTMTSLLAIVTSRLQTLARAEFIKGKVCSYIAR